MTDSDHVAPQINEDALSGPSDTLNTDKADATARTPKRAGFLSNFGIGTRIATIVALPLLAAAGLAGQIIVAGLAELKDDKKTVNLTQISS